MTRPLVTANQLAQIQTVAMAGMVTDIKIYRPTFDENEVRTEEFVADAKGWLSQPSMSVPNIEVAALLTSSTLNLSVPLDTDIRVRDVVVVVASGARYTVDDTSADETWPAKLRVQLSATE